MESTCINKFSSEFYTKTINDPLYGMIYLSDTEIRLLDTKAMQRLRRITQTGYSSYVFPGCEHSRFCHSIGVLHIMGRMCEVLYNSGQMTIDEVRLLRIAALLHDVGHFPFSHLTEVVYSYIESIKTQVLDGTSDNGNKDAILCELANTEALKAYNHEMLGAYVIAHDPQICEILGGESIDPLLVGQIITGETGIRDNSIVYEQLMHSKLDADRLDYLLRDSMQAGVVFGQIDIDYIIKNIKIVDYIVQGSEVSAQCIKVVAIDKKAQHAVEHFLMARYFHYSQTVYHRLTLSIEAVVKYLVFNTLKQQERFSCIEKIKESIGSDEFYSFTDDFLWEQIRIYSLRSKNLVIKKMWESVNDRKKPRILLHLKDIVPKKEKRAVNRADLFLISWLLDHELDQISSECNIDKNCLCYVKKDVKIESIPGYLNAEDCSDFKEETLREAIKMVGKDGKVTLLAADNTSLINKMVDYAALTLVLFVVDPSEEIDIDRLRAHILKLTS
jgi:HD superfamily phosphohydrolase